MDERQLKKALSEIEIPAADDNAKKRAILDLSIGVAEVGSHCIKKGTQIITQHEHDDDDPHRNTGNDQAILKGGNALPAPQP